MQSDRNRLGRKIEQLVCDLERIGETDMGVISHGQACQYHRAVKQLRKFADKMLKKPPAEHYSATGFREGWCVMWSDNRGRFEIQRDDDSSIFRSDEDADAFVRQRAIDGSEPHREAIAVVDGSQCD